MQVLYNFLCKQQAIVVVCALLLCGSLSANATIYYVDAARADNTGAGTSWATAKRDLQVAIDIAASGDEVRVAAGTYKPTHDPFGSTTPADPRDKTFFIKSGVKMYGGYNAATGLRTEAPFGGLGVTTLSGDFLGDDVVTGSGSTLAITNNTENVYHIAMAVALNAGDIGVTIDGFTIKGSNANNLYDITVNGYTIHRASGGGISINNGVNTVINNTFLENKAGNGAGISIINSINTITNNTFLNNKASNYGSIFIQSGTNTISNNTISGNMADRAGGVYIYYGINTIVNNTISGNKSSNGGGIYSDNGTNTIMNNTITGNLADIKGGAIDIARGTNILTNNTISGNTANKGGGIYAYFATNTLTNNTITGNLANSEGGAIYIFGETNILTNNTLSGNTANNGGGIYTNSSTSTLTNNIFWANKKGTDATVQGADYYALGTNSNTFKNNILQLATSNYPISNTGIYAISTAASGNIFATDPLFVNAADPDGADNIWGTVDDGLQLSGCSSAIDAGINTGTPLLDALGNAIYNSLKDMGAYERQSPKQQPTNFALTGGGSYCSGTTSNVVIGLFNSEMATTYQLKNGVTNIGTAINGTGSAISFGNQTAGNYTVVATSTNSGCSLQISDSIIITVLSTITTTPYTVCQSAVPSGGLMAGTLVGTPPSNFTGTTVGAPVYNRPSSTNSGICSNSSNNVSYTTHIFTAPTTGTYTFSTCNTVPTWDSFLALYQTPFNPANGCTGNTLLAANDDNCGALSFISVQLIQGQSYTLVVTGYSSPNTGAYLVTVTNPTPLIVLWYTTSIDGTSIATGNIFNPVGVAGSGISNTNTAGTTTFYAQYQNDICRTPADFIITQPLSYTVTGTGVYCTGGTGLPIGLFNSETGVTYQLKNGATNISTAINGTGSAISFGVQTVGTYTVVATKTIDGCTAEMTGNAVITLDTPPVITTQPTTIAICAGGTGSASVVATGTGLVYQWQFSNNAGVSVTGNAIDPGNTTANISGIPTNTLYYRCKITNASGCIVFSNWVNSTTNARPTITLTGATSGAGSVSLTASGGTTYVWSSGSTPNTAANTFTTLGTYTVTLTITNSNNCSASTATVVTITYPCPTATTLYVNAAIVASGDGTTFAQAYKTLDEALNIAWICPAVARINVASGTYKPTKKPYNNDATSMVTSDARDLTFHIRDGLGIYGGYNAATGLRTEAPFGGLGAGAGGGSILSGDFLGDDVVTGSGNTLAITNNTENAYHVVLANAPITGGVGITVDGFTIKGGNAYVSVNTSITLNGNSVWRDEGGGISIYYGTNTLTNNTILDNSAKNYGGGISTNYSTNTLTNNTISGNLALYGGGIFSYTCTNTLTNNTVSGNYSKYLGGGIYIHSGTNTITNNIILKNSAKDWGGGIYTYNCTNTITNNTISGNSAIDFGGGIYTNYGINTLTNNIFWNNKIGTDASAASADYYADATNDNTFKNNLLQLAASNYPVSNTGVYAIGAAASGNVFATDPLFINATDIDGADNIHRTADDGLRLKPCSPAINAGTNTGISGSDIAGATRIQETTVDMGAYENESFASYTLSNSALTANDECTVGDWTQYYNTTNKNLLLSIKKNGNAIGTVGDGTFSLTVGGSGTTNLGRLGTPTPYTNVDNWYAMNRYWNVTPTTQPTTDVNIRFYYQNTDYTAVQAASGIAAATDMIFYKINGAGNSDPTTAHAGAAATPAAAYNSAGYWEYTNGAAPSSSNWVAGVFNTMAYAETIAASFSGGGGGAGAAGGSALPVKLLTFTGHKDKNLHHLNWATVTEQNASHFEVEVASSDPSQGGGTNGATFRWKNIGNVRAAGNSHTKQYYDFTNDCRTVSPPGEGAREAYYRLKMIDFDGRYEYSNVISLKTDSQVVAIKCYPNPTDNIIYIEATDYTQPVRIIDELGRVLQTHTSIPNSIDLSGFISGTYYIHIGEEHFKILKQ